MIGRTLSHYRILAELGAGGMGVVYRARDERLGRDVALKVLPADVALDPERLARFEREARSVAQLNHPSIVTLYSVEEADGVHFLTMELVEGETLSKLLAGGECCLDRFFELAVPLADAVSCAHGRGVVHRDLKPANIMVDGACRPKVLDFGLAKLFEPGAGADLPGEQPTVAVDGSPTTAGSVLGTPDYMSPEQAEGKAVDHRTDLFSLGVILYEMATGRHPFRGESPAATISSILRDTPPPATDVQPELPRHLGRIIAHCLEKETDRRYQSALDLRNDLAGLRREVESARSPGAEAEEPRRGWRPLRMVATVLAVAVIAVAAWRLWPGSEPARTMIAVLPFENLGPPGEEYFSDGITEAIGAHLAGIKELGVISRQSTNQYKGTDKTLRQIGDELRVEYILQGTIQRERPGDPESPVRVIPQLIRVADDTRLWSTIYDDEAAEVFRVQSEIAESVAMQLDMALRVPPGSEDVQPPTDNLEAYDFYLRGREYAQHYDLTDCELAVPQLRKAVDLDPGFAAAWAELSIAYNTLYWVCDRYGARILQVQAAERARQLAPDSPEALRAVGWVEYTSRNFDRALELFQAAYERRPDVDALAEIGFTMRRQGRFQEALEIFAEAVELAPRHYMAQYDGLGNTNCYIRRFDEAERHYDRAIELDPGTLDPYLDMAYLLVARDGDLESANRFLRDRPQRDNIVEVAELLQASQSGPMIRIFRSEYAKDLAAYEAGPIEQYRQTQPSWVAAIHLAQALIAEMSGDPSAAAARYDSARVHFEQLLRTQPNSAQVAHYRSNLGLALAGLGQCEEALRQGREAVRTLPIARDAFDGTDRNIALAEICLRCGEYDAAIDQLEILLSIPTRVTPHLLRLDPLWDPIRDRPRFRRLVEEL